MTDEPIAHLIQLERSSLLALHASKPERYPALFESAASGKPLGRYDILFAFPGARITLDCSGTIVSDGAVPSSGKFLESLDACWRHERASRQIVSDLPFHGGWLLFLGYELASSIEPSLDLPIPSQNPVAQAVRIPAAIIVEHETKQAWIVVERGCRELIATIEEDLSSLTSIATLQSTLVHGSIVEEAPERYLSAIAKALDYISAGDIYQANLSRAWRAQLAPGVEPHHVYERLRRTNPAPFSAIARFDDLSVISSSPERLVEIRNGWVATRPIAGTRPRGRDQKSDEDLARELRAHPKEQAEHVMLIDLERNDLGRICVAGSVEVNEFMTLETYAHVHHIVSNVRGRLRDDVSPGEVLAAVFPGGTITGCPKIRCMQIIGELEAEARGPYTGSLGYLNRDGTMDMNILIRSLEVRGQSLTLRAGAGIVADSDPQREIDETRAKARGVLRALSEDVSS